ncbi:MAG: nitroreductase [Prevotella sp.]|nr:nitroreductase [Prevotella sp.]
MTIKEAIERRHSVRNYDARSIEKEKLARLTDMASLFNYKSGLQFQIVTDEPKAFSSRLARYGRFSGVSNYIAIAAPKGHEADMLIGYYGEQLVLTAQTLGLNTCWVGLTFGKSPVPINLKEGERLRCVIALGYGTSQGSDHKRKTYKQVAKASEPVPEWFRNGVESALLAPTAINQQKFHFTLHTSEGQLPVVEATTGLGFFSYVDLGIARYHFEVGAGKENFNWK